MKTIPTIMIPCLGTDLEMTTRPAELILREGMLVCSDMDACDYYGEYRGNVAWIAEELQEWANQNNGFWEWENAESISFVE